MKITDPVLAIILDREQAQSVKEDISGSLALGAKTVIIVVDPNPRVDTKRSVSVGPQANMTDVPAPNELIMGTTYVVGIQNELNEVLKNA